MESWAFEDVDQFDTSKRRQTADEDRAQAQPDFDYFKEHPPTQPKAEIGAYVAAQGFNVPLISNQLDWQRVFDAGQAMLRSELPQDYDGLSGLLSSQRLTKYDLDQSQQLGGLYRTSNSYRDKLNTVLLEGLRNGNLDPLEFMNHYQGYRSWQPVLAELAEQAVDIPFGEQQVSRWRYIEGTNVSIFADPNVEGRYHFGVTPSSSSAADTYQPVGSYQYELGEYDQPKQFRKHDQPFLPRAYIDVYQAISKLARFDTSRPPVIELQADLSGNVHFLQYLKTPNQFNYVPEFDLPISQDALITNNVRGVTPPTGQDMRLFICPTILAQGMEAQGILCGITDQTPLFTQLAAQRAGFILHEAYISFQDNHFNSAPLYRPPLAAGCDGAFDRTQYDVLQKVAKLISQVRGLLRHDVGRRTLANYIDIKVTANGRQAVIESDWELKQIAYQDLSTRVR